MQSCKALGIIWLLYGAVCANADPLDDLLAKGSGSACFERIYDSGHLAKHPGQKTRTAMLSLQKAQDWDGAVLRIRFDRTDGPLLIVGGCSWEAKANLDIEDKPLIAAFKGPSGLDCHAETSADGSSAEEGGDFPIDLRDGKAVVYVPDSLAAWRSYDRSKSAIWVRFGKDDASFRLDPGKESICRDLVAKLPYQR